MILIDERNGKRYISWALKKNPIPIHAIVGKELMTEGSKRGSGVCDRGQLMKWASGSMVLGVWLTRRGMGRWQGIETGRGLNMSTTLPFEARWHDAMFSRTRKQMTYWPDTRWTGYIVTGYTHSRGYTFLLLNDDTARLIFFKGVTPAIHLPVCGGLWKPQQKRRVLLGRLCCIRTRRLTASPRRAVWLVLEMVPFDRQNSLLLYTAGQRPHGTLTLKLTVPTRFKLAPLRGGATWLQCSISFCCFYRIAVLFERNSRLYYTGDAYFWINSYILATHKIHLNLINHSCNEGVRKRRRGRREKKMQDGMGLCNLRFLF